MNPHDLKAVLKALHHAEVQEFMLQTSEYTLSLKRGRDAVNRASLPWTPLPTAPSLPAPATLAPSPDTLTPSLSVRTAVKAPIVGTFYAASSPDKPPFVRPGDAVRVGQVLCILEAMKLMNEIESEFEGTVLEVCVGDGEPVEYGQVLFWVG